MTTKFQPGGRIEVSSRAEIHHVIGPLVIKLSHVENNCAGAVCWHFRKNLVEGDDNEDCYEEAHIFDIENMRVVKEFNSVGDLILVARL